MLSGVTNQIQIATSRSIRHPRHRRDRVGRRVARAPASAARALSLRIQISNSRPESGDRSDVENRAVRLQAQNRVFVARCESGDRSDGENRVVRLPARGWVFVVSQIGRSTIVALGGV